MPLQKPDTILYEVQQACIQLSLTSPTDVFGSDETALLMGSIANLAGIMVNDAYDWQGQRRTWSITGDGVTLAWDLPDDFARFVDETGWATDMTTPVSPVNAQGWAHANAWTGSYYIYPLVRIREDQLHFQSPPSSGQVITFEYIDCNWVLDGTDLLTLKQKVEQNSDVPVFDWLLMILAIKVKWLETKRMDNTGATADFNDRIRQLCGNEILGARLSLNGSRGVAPRYLDGYTNVPESGFGS